MATREVSDKAFEEAMKIMTRDFGRGFSCTGKAEEHLKAIPTTYPDLDEVLTAGAYGIYQGGIIELMGEPSSGKTSLALRICGSAQKMGMKCCWIDAEASFDSNLAKINGCSPEALIIPDLVNTAAADIKGETLGFLNVTEILEMVYQAIVKNIFSVIVIDSVAGLMPESVLADSFDPNKVGIAEVARAMSRMLPKIAQACKKTETSVILINQLRDKPGEYYLDRYNSPGGRAIRFYSSSRLHVIRRGGEDGKIYRTNENGQKELFGHTSYVTVVKSKKHIPINDKIEIQIYYKEYFPDDAHRAYECARKLKVISVRNGIYTWKKDDKIVAQIEGESAMIDKIRSEHLVKLLVQECLLAQDDPKNKDLKVPVKVPQSLAKLVDNEEEKPVEIKLAEEAEPKKKKKDKLNIL